MKGLANSTLFRGILYNNRRFSETASTAVITYPTLITNLELTKKYHLDKLTTGLDNLGKVIAIMNYFSGRLAFRHELPDLTTKDAGLLLKNSFERENNVLNTDEIIAIYQAIFIASAVSHRVIYLNSYSPYDYFRYPLVEIYHEATGKWLVFDLLANCLFVDEKGAPKSLFEVRVALAKGELIIPVSRLVDDKMLTKVIKRAKYLDYLALITKYIFFFTIDTDQNKLADGSKLIIAPLNFDYDSYINEKLFFINNEIMKITPKNKQQPLLMRYRLYKEYLIKGKTTWQGYKFLLGEKDE